MEGREAGDICGTPFRFAPLRPLPVSPTSFVARKQAFRRQITCIHWAPPPSRVRGWTRPGRSEARPASPACPFSFSRPVLFSFPEFYRQTPVAFYCCWGLVGSDGQPKLSHRQSRDALWGLCDGSALTVIFGLELLDGYSRSFTSLYINPDRRMICLSELLYLDFNTLARRRRCSVDKVRTLSTPNSSRHTLFLC